MDANVFSKMDLMIYYFQERKKVLDPEYDPE